MKIKNKKTGEMGDLIIDKALLVVRTGTAWLHYSSLAELSAEWEDAPEEPKEHWYIDCDGEVISPSEALCNEEQNSMKQIGNYFETREEAEKAVEKLKAWTRLKDEGMRIYSFKKEKTGIDLDFYTLTILAPRDKDSLDLLFGGEE